MPLLFFILLVILIAQLGFWDTFGAVLGAVAMMVLFVVLAAGVVVVGFLAFARRLFDRRPGWPVAPVAGRIQPPRRRGAPPLRHPATLPRAAGRHR